MSLAPSRGEHPASQPGAGWLILASGKDTRGTLANRPNGDAGLALSCFSRVRGLFSASVSGRNINYRKLPSSVNSKNVPLGPPLWRLGQTLDATGQCLGSSGEAVQPGREDPLEIMARLGTLS